MAAKVVSKIEQGRPATSVHGFFWLFFVLVLVLVLDRSCDCIIPSCSTRCSGGNLVMDRITEIRSMIRELGNGGLWAVTQVALMPWTAKRSITSTSTVRYGGLSTSTMGSCSRNAPGPRLACPTGSTASSASGKQHPLPRKVARLSLIHI
jgi:hypothetical protein